MCMTAVYVRAQVQRAEIEGAKDVTLNVKDMLEILSYVDSGVAKERAEGRMKPAGWVSAKDIRKMRLDKGCTIRMSRRKSPERCMQVYHRDELRDMELESLRLQALRLEEQKDYESRKETKHVPSPIP